jgi:hypothetical protein
VQELAARGIDQIIPGATQDPTRGNRKSQFPDFGGESTPQVDSTYLSGKLLEPFIFTIFTRKI